MSGTVPFVRAVPVPGYHLRVVTATELPVESRVAPASLAKTAAAAAAALVFWFLPLGLSPLVQHALAISLFMVVAWITHAIDHALAGFIGCYLFWALKVADFPLAFAGFADSTPWFLMGAVFFGVMATKSGLARRLAYLVMRAVGPRYARLLFGLILADFLLTFLVPSGIARVVIMAAVALGLMEAFGVGRTSNIARGMFIILTYTATIFDKMIIAGAASIVARGAIERVGGVEVLWSRWFLAYLPCDLITIFVAWRLTLYFYPPEKPALPGGESVLKEAVRALGPWSALEKRAAFLMATAILLWMTDFMYHIPLGDETSMLATSVPVLMTFAKAHRLDPLALGMVWTFGAGAKIFVYQSAPMVVGYSYGCFTARDMLKIGACLTVVESLIMIVIVPFYWPLIGI